MCAELPPTTRQHESTPYPQSCVVAQSAASSSSAGQRPSSSVAVIRAGLDEAHAARGIVGEPGGQHAPRGTRADDADVGLDERAGDTATVKHAGAANRRRLVEPVAGP